MFIFLAVMLLLLLVAAVLSWRVFRQRRLVPLVLVLSPVCAVILWLAWTRDLSYTVSAYVDAQLTSSHQEDVRTWFKLFVTCELSLILAAAIALVARRACPTSWSGQ